MAKKRAISIIERRLQSGSIFGTSSKPIPLKDPKAWALRIVNSKVNNQHLYDMQAEKGWIYVVLDDLDVRPDEIGFRELDGRIVRGTQGEEVLMKMPLADFKLVQKEKEKVNRSQTLGKKAVRNTIMGAMHAAGDDQGAAFMEKALNSAKIEDGVERVPLGND
jgi:hypothetical protein